MPDFLDVIKQRRGEGNDVFEALACPERMGNPAAIAYGGWTLAFGVQAAFYTIERPGFAIYSIVGHYLGPASTERPLTATVARLRETRSFSTRLVTVSQKQADGVLRPCLSMTLDFIASPSETDNDTISTLRYSVKPLEPTPRPEDVPDWDEDLDRRAKSGEVHPKVLAGYLKIFELWKRYIETRIPKSAPFYSRLFGVDATKKTSQDDRTLTDRSSSSWIRSRTDFSDSALAAVQSRGALPFTSQGATAAFVSFALDGALSFAPLSFSGRSLGDAAAISSLDFALRFTHDRPNLNKWCLHEIRTVAGGWGRTFDEARLFDESGSLIATMSQQCILRPFPPKTGTASAKL